MDTKKLVDLSSAQKRALATMLADLRVNNCFTPVAGVSANGMYVCRRTARVLRRKRLAIKKVVEGTECTELTNLGICAAEILNLQRGAAGQK